MRETILVTGGAGYVGSHACKALARAGFLPVSYDSLVRGHAQAVKWGPLEVGDITDAARLDDVLVRHRPAAVLHFAGYIFAGESVADPALYYRNNVAGSLTLLEAMRRHGVRRIVFSSSAAVYGAARTGPIREAHPLAPSSPYGATKMIVERMLADFAAADGLRWLALRYFNAAGADPEGETGELHDPEHHLIPRVLDVAAGRAPAICVNGDDHETPDGTCLRDYVHVCDLADAHVLALAHLLNGGESAALNLGAGRGHSVREVIAAARRVTGHAIPATVGPRRPEDPPALVADAGLAGRLLGWKARRAALETQIADAWNWHRRIRNA